MNKSFKPAVILNESLVESQGLMPTLARAVLEHSNNNIDKYHQNISSVFRKVDIKKTELDTYLMAHYSDVVQTIESKNEQGNPVKRFIVKNSRNIGFLAKKIGYNETHAIIRILLANLNDYFNVKNGLTVGQTRDIADMIIEECGPNLYIDELIYIFKKAKVQAKLYERLDGSIIFEWIDSYYQARAEQRHTAHKTEKVSMFKPILHEDLLEKFKIVTPNMEKGYERRDMKSLGIDVTKIKVKRKKN